MSCLSEWYVGPTYVIRGKAATKPLHPEPQWAQKDQATATPLE